MRLFANRRFLLALVATIFCLNLLLLAPSLLRGDYGPEMFLDLSLVPASMPSSER
ncbi:hypothetical protein HDU98_001359, partial [Podochytrium sp. JEL0797]